MPLATHASPSFAISLARYVVCSLDLNSTQNSRFCSQDFAFKYLNTSVYAFDDGVWSRMGPSRVEDVAPIPDLENAKQMLEALKANHSCIRGFKPNWSWRCVPATYGSYAFLVYEPNAVDCSNKIMRYSIHYITF